MRSLVLLGIGSLALMGCEPKTYEVKREIVIDAPADAVFTEVNNLKAQGAWSPWEAKDPNMERIYEGPEAGVGARYIWKGNEEVGHGSMEILEAEPNKYIKTNLIFTEPWQSESIIIWTFEPLEGGTKATWSVHGELPGFMFWMGEDDMDKMMGPDFESGLAKLKAVVEENRSSTTAYSHQLVDVEAMDYYYTAHSIPFSEMSSDLFASNYEKIAAYLAEDAAKMSSPPLAIFHEWNEDTQTTKMEIAMACNSKKPAKGDIKKGKTFAGKAMMVSHKGPYEGTEAAHEFLHTQISQSEYTFAGSPWEVYVSGPEEDPNPENWITEIYYPVAPKGSLNASL